MDEEIVAGIAVGGMVGGAVAGLPGALVGGTLGGLLGDAYSKKPAVGSFATTVRNDLKPENVTLDAHQIYVRITTGHGLESLIAASDTAKQLTSSFADRVNQIAKARNASAEAWQGNASAAASAATAPLSESFAAAQQQLAANSQALSTQIAAFTHIHSQVEPVPATPPQSGISNAANPFQTDVDAAINEYNAKAAKNVALYEAYSADTAAARSQVPQTYAGPAPLSGTAAAIGRTASPIGSASPSAPLQGGSAADAGQPVGTNASAAGGGPMSAPLSPGGGSGMPSGSTGQASTDPAARQTPTTPPLTTTPGGMPAARGTYPGSPLTGLPRPPGASAQHDNTAAGPGFGALSGFGGAPGGGYGGGGGTGTRGGLNTGGPNTGGPNTGGPGTRGFAAGTGPVPGQPSPGAGQPAGRSGAGGPAARGAAGLGGLPMGAPGRTDGEEDQEHQRKYVIEPDEDLFGVDEECAPPVIGDDR